MTNDKIVLTSLDLVFQFEKFPKGLTLQDLNIFLEWFNQSFSPKQKNKIYLRECFNHYHHYLQTHRNSTGQTLLIQNFNKLLSLTLLQVKIKQGLNRQNNELKHYVRKRDKQSFFFVNFELVNG